MIRTSRLLAIVALSAAATGCATFSDNSLAARVGDVELSHDDLRDRLDGVERADGTAARTEIDEFIRRTAADRSGLFERYSAADGSLGISCFYVVPVADRAQADDVIARVTGGEPWDDVVESIAPGASAQSRQPCGPTSQFIPEIAGTLAALDPDGEPQVIEATDPAGTFVVRAHTVEELDVLEFLTAISSADPLVLEGFVTELRDGDVYVDPRFGDFDPARFTVVPLG